MLSQHPDDTCDSLELALEAGGWCGRFGAAWRGGDRAELAGGPLRRVALGELACLDLEYRLQADEPARVEGYFTAYPELRADPEAALRLVAVEWRARARRESGLSPAEYRERFPDLAGHPGW